MNLSRQVDKARTIDHHLQKPLLPYTLASAVRRNASEKSNEDNKISATMPAKNNPIRNKISLEIEKTLQSTNPATHFHSNSNLPMGMVVSKMATRKPIPKTVGVHQEKTDYSRYRSYKLSPPSWKRKNLTKQIHPKKYHQSSFQKIVESMKSKCNQFKLTDCNIISSIPSNGNWKAKENNSDSSQINENNTDLKNNYKALYCKQWNHEKSNDAANQSSNDAADEDPFGDLSEGPFETDNNKTSNKLQQTEIEQYQESDKFVFNPILSSTHHEIDERTFEWNPVLVFDASKKPLFSPPNPDGYQPKKQPSCFDSPCSLSSSSSGHTIAEERLRVTYFTKRCRTIPHNLSPTTHSGSEINQVKTFCFSTPLKFGHSEE